MEFRPVRRVDPDLRIWGWFPKTEVESRLWLLRLEIRVWDRWGGAAWRAAFTKPCVKAARKISGFLHFLTKNFQNAP